MCCRFDSGSWTQAIGGSPPLPYAWTCSSLAFPAPGSVPRARLLFLFSFLILVCNLLHSPFLTASSHNSSHSCYAADFPPMRYEPQELLEISWIRVHILKIKILNLGDWMACPRSYSGGRLDPGLKAFASWSPESSLCSHHSSWPLFIRSSLSELIFTEVLWHSCSLCIYGETEALSNLEFAQSQTHLPQTRGGYSF